MHFNNNNLFGVAVAMTGLGDLGVTAQEEWRSEDGGNVRMHAGDDIINWGKATPWSVMQRIKEHCSSVGCHGANTMEFETEFVHQASHFDGTLEVSIEGSFQSENELGSLENLVDLATELVADGGTYDVEERFWHTGACTGGNIDPCSTMETHSIDQYHQTNLVLVRVEDDEGSQLANLHVHVTATRHDDDNSGWCDIVTTVGSSVAGAVDRGVAGGLFSLLSLGCQAL